MAVFLPMEEENSNTPLSASEIQAFEELQEMDSFESISTAALMSRLHLKFLQRPWSETGKLVRACMNKPKTGSTTTSRSPMSSCLEKLHRAISAKDLFAVTNKLEIISKQKRLNSHTSPNGTTFYITSEMFYIEIQLKVDGEVIEVKLAHPGGSPEICEDLLQVLRMKNYDAFGKILEELLNVYQIPGDSKTKAKVYLALQSLEKDISSLSLLHRAPDTDRVTKIVCGKVGYLRPRTAGTPMNLEFYLSPIQILEEQLTPGLQVPGMKVFVTIGGSDVTYTLPIHPLIGDSWPEADGDVLNGHGMLMASGRITINGLNLAPLHDLILHQTLSEKHRDDPTKTNYFFVSLPDCPKHCYYIGNGTEGSALTGAMVSKLPFTHPKDVPDMIEVLRHQAAYNTLVSSCISGTANHEAVIDVPSSKEVMCTLHTVSKDWAFNKTEDFFTRVLKRCMSVPILMRSIFKAAAKQKPDEAVQSMEEMSEQSPQEASESEATEDSGAGLQNAGMAWESRSPDIAESLPESSSQASLSDTTEEDTVLSTVTDPEENPTSAEPSDDMTEANTSLSSLPVLSGELEELLLFTSEDISGFMLDEGITDEPWTPLNIPEEI